MFVNVLNPDNNLEYLKKYIVFYRISIAAYFLFIAVLLFSQLHVSHILMEFLRTKDVAIAIKMVSVGIYSTIVLSLLAAMRSFTSLYSLEILSSYPLIRSNTIFLGNGRFIKLFKLILIIIICLFVITSSYIFINMNVFVENVERFMKELINVSSGSIFAFMRIRLLILDFISRNSLMFISITALYLVQWTSILMVCILDMVNAFMLGTLSRKYLYTIAFFSISALLSIVSTFINLALLFTMLMFTIISGVYIFVSLGELRYIVRKIGFTEPGGKSDAS